MKIILSRKGFDSSYGGYASPIFPDGSILSLPIPNMRYLQAQLNRNKRWLYFDGSEYIPSKYKDLRIPTPIRRSLSKLGVEIKNFRDLLINLLPNGKIKEKINKKIETFDSNVNWYCHLDPDLKTDFLPRNLEWSAIFGQVKAAQSHLQNEKVGRNDLFLYFGWFRKTKIIKEKGKSRLIYDSGDKEGRHLIYGYLQIDKILTKKNESQINSWMKPHPHLGKNLWNTKNNTLYIANKTLSWNENYFGGGYFHFNEDLVLTEENKKKNPKGKRSLWKYNYFPIGTDITYHNKERWVKKVDENGNQLEFFQSAYPGQEFVINNCETFIEKVKNWKYYQEL